MHVHSYYIYINVIDQFGFPGGSMIRICLPMQEMQGLSLDWVEPLQKEMATHSGILAWEILWTETPGRLQSMRSERDEYASVTHSFTLSKVK